MHPTIMQAYDAVSVTSTIMPTYGKTGHCVKLDEAALAAAIAELSPSSGSPGPATISVPSALDHQGRARGTGGSEY